MSNLPQSNKHPSNKDSMESIDELADDIDFWNIDTGQTNADLDAKALSELEQILSEPEVTEPLRLSINPAFDSEISFKKIELPSISKSNKSHKLEELPESAELDIDKILSHASAKINTEREMQDNLSYLHESEPTHQKIYIPNTSLEKISTLACYLALIGIFSYLIYYASQQHNFDTSKPYAANTPAKGDYANVESIETWWSEPDGYKTKLGVILVPTATITLDSNSKSGFIRSVFYSYEESLLGQLKPKGDPLTHEFVDGKFIETGTNQITVYCTDGLEKLAHYAFYRDQDEKRWTIEVKEAATLQSSIDNFKPLANAPIDPIRK